MELPNWDTLDKKALEGQSLNPIERFIHDNEPSGFGDMLWRAQLQRALEHAIEETKIELLGKDNGTR